MRTANKSAHVSEKLFCHPVALLALFLFLFLVLELEFELAMPKLPFSHDRQNVYRLKIEYITDAFVGVSESRRESILRGDYEHRDAELEHEERHEERT
jgi:hypothetical protein